MKLIDILKAQGVTDEQINKITASMKENNDLSRAEHLP